MRAVPPGGARQEVVDVTRACAFAFLRDLAACYVLLVVFGAAWLGLDRVLGWLR